MDMALATGAEVTSPPEITELRARIEREERLAGLAPDGFVTAKEIRARRAQILGVMALVLVALGVTTIAYDVWSGIKAQSFWVDPELLRIAMIVFAGGFVVYVLEKEHHLKRLSSLGRRAEELDLVLAERMLMSASIAQATEALGVSLDLEEVLAGILREADHLVGASLGAVSLFVDGGHLDQVWARGPSVAGIQPLVAEAVLVQVAMAREPLLLVGALPPEMSGALPTANDVASVACIPLVRSDVVLGVMTIAARVGHRFSTDDLDVLSRLAVPAAAAIANARRFEAARLQDFDGIDTCREELREIGRSIRDSVVLARREDLHRQGRAELLDRIDSHAAHLLREVG